MLGKLKQHKVCKHMETTEYINSVFVLHNVIAHQMSIILTKQGVCCREGDMAPESHGTTLQF